MTRVGRPAGRRLGALGVALFALLSTPLAASALEPESSWSDWFSENFEVHGFVTSKAYFRTPNFGHEPELNAWRNEINLEFQARLYRGDDWRVGFFGVLRPIYDAVYEVQSDLWGNSANRAQFGTAGAFPDNANASDSGQGNTFPGHGGRLDGEFTIINADTGTLFTGKRAAAVAIDNVVFFGRVTAPWAPKGSRQGTVGGNATGETYEDLRDNFGLLLIPGQSPGFGTNFFANATLPPGAGLDGSLAMAGTTPGSIGFGSAVSAPLNFYAGAVGSSGSLRFGSADINRGEDRLKFDCRDNAHPYCFVRELYVELEYQNTFVRLGKQQIVWGKTDAFRLQDKINPIDFGYHNVFPDLEERRIPQLALDVIQSFGNVGPLQDVSLEFAWVFDRFIPDQFGQCGEPWAFTAACEARADAGGHGLFNLSLASVDEVHWQFKNTEPGLRLEFRTPEPSIAFSLSAFWTHQDLPVARFKNLAAVDNPNSASMLFLQGITDGTGTPVAGTIDFLSSAAAGIPGAPAPYSGGVWLAGFDPYARADTSGTPVGSLAAANGDLQNAWFMLTNVLDPANGGCAGVTGPALRDCGGAIAVFALPWSASEAILEYPRLFTIGASMDYQIPGIDTVLRLEMAAEFDRDIQNTAKRDQVDESHVFQAAVGIDRSTFIPFLNRNRTAFLSFQTFVEHIVDYDDGSGRPNDGMVPYETSVISTFFMQNYWRNDSLILTTFVAGDWQAGAIITGPTLRYIFNEHLFFDVGVNLLWGRKREHNIRDLCVDGSLSCLADPTSWQDGNWQMLNGPLNRTARSPWFGKESFADKFMQNRDEFWFGVTYQF